MIVKTVTVTDQDCIWIFRQNISNLTLNPLKAAKLPEIKMAYFKQAKKFHPDANPGDEARWMFELTAEAYDVLSSEEKRKGAHIYDATIPT